MSSTLAIHDTPVFAMGGSNVLAYPFESSEALPKQVVLSPANVRYDWEPQGPHTWLIVHRPYPLSPNDSVLSRIDAMLAHVLCRILGAYSLRKLWCETMTGVETAEKKTNMKRMAFDWWPLSFNQIAAWKKIGGTSEEEGEPAEELIV